MPEFEFYKGKFREVPTTKSRLLNAVLILLLVVMGACLATALGLTIYMCVLILMMA